MTTLPYPYLVFYQVGDAEVIIHSIRHAAQRPMELLDLE
jgi:plasmid stabilization system protein ParE